MTIALMSLGKTRDNARIALGTRHFFGSAHRTFLGRKYRCQLPKGVVGGVETGSS